MAAAMVDAMMPHRCRSPMAVAVGRVISAMRACAMAASPVSSTAVTASRNRRQAGKAQDYGNGPP